MTNQKFQLYFNKWAQRLFRSQSHLVAILCDSMNMIQMKLRTRPVISSKSQMSFANEQNDGKKVVEWYKK